MKKINCVVIDDEPPALEILENYIEKIPQFHLIGLYTDAIKALSEINKTPVDVVFCDIEMPDINGLQFIEVLNHHKRPLLVMVSAYSKYAIEGFNLDVTDYLLKPVPFPRFLKTVQKIMDCLANIDLPYVEKTGKPSATSDDSGNYIFVKSNNKLHKIIFSSILYVESLSDYIKIYTEDSKRPILSLTTLKNLEEILPANQFKRIHRSYIVHLSKIKAIEYRKVILADNVSLPISNTYYNGLYEYLVSNNILK